MLRPELPTAVSLLDPFADGHHVSYAGWLAAGLLERGVRVHLIGPQPWTTSVLAMLEPELRSRVAVTTLDIHPEPLADYFALPTPRRESYDLRFLRAAAQAARAHGSQVLHALYLDRFLLPLLAAWPAFQGLNVQATLHWATFLPQYRPSSHSGLLRALAETWALARLLRLGLQVQVHSERLAHQLDGRCGRVWNVPYPAPAEEPSAGEGAQVQALRDRLGLTGRDQLLLAFGNTRFDKGADLAAQVLPLLPDHVHLLVAGKAKHFDADALTRLAGRAAHRLHLHLNFVPDDQIRPTFLAADAVLLPYRPQFAGQSGPLTIAASLGVPVVAAETGVLGETVRAYDLGRMFPSEDLTGMAGAVQAVLAEPTRTASLNFVQDHTLEAFVRAVLAGYARGRRVAVRPAPATQAREMSQES